MIQDQRLAEFERQSGIKYVRAGWYASPKADEYRSFREIPDFGMEPSELISAAREFIVVRPDYDIQFERIDLIDGGIDFIVGRSSNPESLVLRPGGIYREGVLIGGGVATASNDPSLEQKDRFRAFAKILTNGCVPIRDWQRRVWHLGPESLILLRNGARLITRSAETPDNAEDLKYEDVQYFLTASAGTK